MSKRVLTLTLPCSGESTTANLGETTIDGLKSMQALVGGLIQPCDLYSDDNGTVSLYVNEEGIMHELTFNRTASDLLAAFWIPRYGSSNPLFGNAFISRFDHETGETVSLTDDDVSFLTERLKMFA